MFLLCCVAVDFLLKEKTGYLRYIFGLMISFFIVFTRHDLCDCYFLFFLSLIFFYCSASVQGLELVNYGMGVIHLVERNFPRPGGGVLCGVI